jgi:hypothetical protein
MRTILVIVLFSSVSFAGDFKLGKYASESLSFGVGGRALGLGGAYTALARDVSAIYWNPAGLANIEFPQVMLMHSQLYRGVVNYNFAGFALPMGANRTIGFGLTRVSVDDIPVTDLSDPTRQLGELYQNENGELVQNRPIQIGTISDAEYAFYLSYAIRRSEKFSYGANVKVLHKGVGDYSAWGLGFDIGMLYNPSGNLFLGANLNDVTSTILAWDTGRREIIVPALKLGASYPVILPFLGGYISPAVDLELRFEGRDYAAQVAAGPVSADAHFGGEYQFKDLLAVRVGSDAGKFAAGAGIRLPKLQIDYAYVQHEDLHSSHRISARLTIQEQRFRRP